MIYENVLDLFQITFFSGEGVCSTVLSGVSAAISTGIIIIRRLIKHEGREKSFLSTLVLLIAYLLGLLLSIAQTLWVQDCHFLQ